jgi:hypothetical protein
MGNDFDAAMPPRRPDEVAEGQAQAAPALAKPARKSIRQAREEARQIRQAQDARKAKLSREHAHLSLVRAAQAAWDAGKSHHQVEVRDKAGLIGDDLIAAVESVGWQLRFFQTLTRIEPVTITTKPRVDVGIHWYADVSGSGGGGVVSYVYLFARPG